MADLLDWLTPRTSPSDYPPSEMCTCINGFFLHGHSICSGRCVMRLVETTLAAADEFFSTLPRDALAGRGNISQGTTGALYHISFEPVDQVVGSSNGVLDYGDFEEYDTEFGGSSLDSPFTPDLHPTWFQDTLPALQETNRSSSPSSEGSPEYDSIFGPWIDLENRISSFSPSPTSEATAKSEGESSEYEAPVDRKYEADVEMNAIAQLKTTYNSQDTNRSGSVKGRRPRKRVPVSWTAEQTEFILTMAEKVRKNHHVDYRKLARLYKETFGTTRSYCSIQSLVRRSQEKQKKGIYAGSDLNHFSVIPTGSPIIKHASRPSINKAFIKPGAGKMPWTKSESQWLLKNARTIWKGSNPDWERLAILFAQSFKAPRSPKSLRKYYARSGNYESDLAYQDYICPLENRHNLFSAQLIESSSSQRSVSPEATKDRYILDKEDSSTSSHHRSPHSSDQELSGRPWTAAETEWVLENTRKMWLDCHPDWKKITEHFCQHFEFPRTIKEIRMHYMLTDNYDRDWAEVQYEHARSSGSSFTTTKHSDTDDTPLSGCDRMSNRTNTPPSQDEGFEWNSPVFTPPRWNRPTAGRWTTEQMEWVFEQASILLSESDTDWNLLQKMFVKKFRIQRRMECIRRWYLVYGVSKGPIPVLEDELKDGATGETETLVGGTYRLGTCGERSDSDSLHDYSSPRISEAENHSMTVYPSTETILLENHYVDDMP